MEMVSVSQNGEVSLQGMQSGVNRPERIAWSYAGTANTTGTMPWKDIP